MDDIAAIRAALEQHSLHLVTDAEFKGRIGERLDAVESRLRFWRGVGGSALVGTAVAFVGFTLQAVTK